MDAGVRREVRGLGGLLAGAVSAVLVLAPLLLDGGFALTYDMVFVPDPPLDEALLGLGSAVPRAVPSDLVVAVVAQVLPASVVQRLVLAGFFVLGAWGAARLLPRDGLLPAAVAGTAYVWTAATYERLVLGQWALLVSLAALPWVVAAAGRVRAGAPLHAWASLVLALLAAAVGSPAGGLMCAAVAVVVVGSGRQARATLAAAVVGLAVLLPWVVPSLLRPGGVDADPAGLAAFAPRADTPLGSLGSLLTLGGVWNAQVVPPGRDSWPVALATLTLVAVGLGGVWLLRAQPWWWAGIACAAAGLVVAMLPSLPGGTELAAALPGGGLLRDGQKFVAPYALLVAVGLGAAAARLPLPLPGALLVLPVAVVPALVWGATGRLQPVAYPPDAGTVRALVAAAPAEAVSLPWTAFRRPRWNDRRTMLDPVPRLLGVPVVVDDDLVLADRVVEGEDPRAAALDDALSGAGPVVQELARAGIGWAVLAKGEPGSDAAAAQLAGAQQVHDGPSYALFRLPPARVQAPEPPRPAALPVVLADLATLLLGASAATVLAIRRLRG